MQSAGQGSDKDNHVKNYSIYLQTVHHPETFNKKTPLYYGIYYLVVISISDKSKAYSYHNFINVVTFNN